MCSRAISSSQVRIPARSGLWWTVPSISTRPVPPLMSCTAVISPRLRFHRTPQRVSPSSGLSGSLQRHRSPTDTPRSRGAQTGALMCRSRLRPYSSHSNRAKINPDDCLATRQPAKDLCRQLRPNCTSAAKGRKLRQPLDIGATGLALCAGRVSRGASASREREARRAVRPARHGAGNGERADAGGSVRAGAARVR
jgi:hypothetical protein